MGMAKKLILADRFALAINPLWEALGAGQQLGFAGSWAAVLGYTFRIYFDFSGYSDMAVGLGHLFGLRIPQNFNSPYRALDIADFWRRWHISLSTCLRDYLYIPLGGNRGPRWMVYRNLMITMLPGGLWQGASWTFVVWGGYHGLLLVLYQAIRGSWDRLPASARRVATCGVVVVGWVFFRSETFEMATSLLTRMFSWHAGSSLVGGPMLLGMLIVAGVAAHWGPNTFELPHRWSPPYVAGFALLLRVCLLFLYGA